MHVKNEMKGLIKYNCIMTVTIGKKLKLKIKIKGKCCNSKRNNNSDVSLTVPTEVKCHNIKRNNNNNNNNNNNVDDYLTSVVPAEVKHCKQLLKKLKWKLRFCVSKSRPFMLITRIVVVHFFRSNVFKCKTVMLLSLFLHLSIGPWTTPPSFCF